MNDRDLFVTPCDREKRDVVKTIFKVTVTQKLAYTDTLVAEFDNIHNAYDFIALVLNSCKEVSVNIIMVTEDEATKEAD